VSEKTALKILARFAYAMEREMGYLSGALKKMCEISEKLGKILVCL